MTERAVYVVDDEEPIQRSLHLMLRTMKFAPQVFAGGEAFLDHSGQLEPGCVLIDLRMPVIDGLEVQRRLLEQSSLHSVIVMSGHGDLGAALTAFEQGAIAFLEKPFARAPLAELLRIAFLRLEDPPAYHAHLRSAVSAVGALTAADRTVLDLIVRGHELETIATLAHSSHAMVELARSRIFAQLGAPTLVDALRITFAARRAALR